MNGAVGQGQSRMWNCRDDARMFPDVGDAGSFLLLFQPGELARELFPHGLGHLEFEQEGAAHGVADKALEVAEIVKMGGDAIADLAGHRYVDHHPERRNACGPAREAAWLSLRVKPSCETVAPANGDIDGSLFEKLFDRHSASSRKVSQVGERIFLSHQGFSNSQRHEC